MSTETIRTIPHFQVGPVELRYDVGDEYARRFGMPMAPTGCGEVVVSTLVTKTRSKVRCPECLSTLAAKGGGAP